MTDYWGTPNKVISIAPLIEFGLSGSTDIVAYKGVRSYSTDTTGQLVVQLATTRTGWGIALETVATAGLPVSILLRGLIVLVSAGSTRNKAQYFDSAGEPIDLSDQAINEAGSATCTIYYSAKVAIALQTIADNSEGLYYFCP